MVSIALVWWGSGVRGIMCVDGWWDNASHPPSWWLSGHYEREFLEFAEPPFAWASKGVLVHPPVLRRSPVELGRLRLTSFGAV